MSRFRQWFLKSSQSGRPRGSKPPPATPGPRVRPGVEALGERLLPSAGPFHPAGLAAPLGHQQVLFRDGLGDASGALTITSDHAGHFRGVYSDPALGINALPIQGEHSGGGIHFEGLLPVGRLGTFHDQEVQIITEVQSVTYDGTLSWNGALTTTGHLGASDTSGLDFVVPVRPRHGTAFNPKQKFGFGVVPVPGQQGPLNNPDQNLGLVGLAQSGRPGSKIKATDVVFGTFLPL
jgi:hypothetical protein